jgi:hypothetical protein
MPDKLEKRSENEALLAQEFRGPNSRVFENSDGVVTVEWAGVPFIEWDTVNSTAQIFSGGELSPVFRRKINRALESIGFESTVTIENNKWYVNAPAVEPVEFEEGFTVTAVTENLVEPDEDPDDTQENIETTKEDLPEKETAEEEQLKKGTKHEAEHDSVYTWIEEAIAANGVLPTIEEFREKIAADHIDKIPDYYDRLDDMEEGLEDVPDKNEVKTPTIVAKRKVRAATEPKVYDMGEDALDRFTVVISDDVYSMSHDPVSPSGYNLWIGNLSEYDVANFGKEVPMDSLPDSVKIAIEDRLNDYSKEEKNND